MLKADLHLHAGEDKTHKLKYSSKELIDHAAKLGFEVLAFTLHKDVFYNKEIADYAKKKGILLIPGVERYIEGKEVLIYNVIQEQAEKLNTFEDLREFRKKNNVLIIAPHPFFKRPSCLGKKLVENIDLFDAIEYSHFYLPFLNLNKKAVNIARKHSLPMIGNSDTHHLVQLGMTCSLIDSKKDLNSVFEAIKKGKISLKTKPAPLGYFIWRTIVMALDLE
ncbi:MAG: PHP domain-containing protein [Nanoarchaeota archaeon]|nr:PHP domain-containing protein [DPANN group archaeon]MBL7116323.1 PHP domain-containing protein [Nanoarchaeota archaeon]